MRLKSLVVTGKNSYNRSIFTEVIVKISQGVRFFWNTWYKRRRRRIHRRFVHFWWPCGLRANQSVRFTACDFLLDRSVLSPNICRFWLGARGRQTLDGSYIACNVRYRKCQYNNVSAMYPQCCEYCRCYQRTTV